MARLRLDLGAEPADVDVDGSGIADLVGAPDTVEQLPPRESAAGMCSEGRQELELLSAVVPTLLATTFFEPQPTTAEATEDFDAAEEIDAGPLGGPPASAA